MRLHTASVRSLVLILGTTTLAACHHSSNNGGSGAPPATYTVGGSITGLNGSITLTNNGGDTRIVTTNGTFTFTTALSGGAAYAVAISAQPTNQSCTVTSGSGTVAAANITNVAVACTQLYTVGGTVSGLSGSITLGNGANVLTLTAGGAFTLPGAFATGTAYSVAITAQPTNQQCTLANAGGNIAAANVTNVGVTCDTFRVTSSVGPTGGTVNGPDGVQVVIPAGALTQSITVGIARSPGGWPTPLVDNATPLGSIYEITPHDTIFAKPVLIRFPVTTAPTGAFVSTFDTGWAFTDIFMNGSFAEIERHSFSWYYLFAPGLPCANTGNDPYPCVYPSGLAYADATPADAITLTSGVAAGITTTTGAAGSAGTWAVDSTRVTTVDLTMVYTAAPDCSNAHVIVSKYSPPPPNGVQATATPITDQPTAAGSGRITLSLTPAQLHLAAGTNLYYYGFRCTRPGHGETGGADWFQFDVAPNATPGVTVGGTVTNLFSPGLQLRNAKRDAVTVPANATTFTFPTPLLAGLPFDVKVSQQPTGQNCTVANGSGTANANVTNVAITCTGTPPVTGGLLMTANSASNTLGIYRRDATTGALSALGTTATGNPFRIVLTPDGKFAYVTNTGSNTVSSFTVDKAGGTLTPIPLSSPATTNPYGIAMDPQGRFVLVVNHSTNQVSTFAINALTGELTAAATPVTTGSLPYGIAMHPSGNFAYVTNEFGNSVSAYSVSAGGQLTLIGTLANSVLKPHDITVDPTGKFAYVAEVTDRAIAAFSIDQTTGALTSGAFASLGSGFGESVVAHPNGKFLYASNRLAPGGVFVFSINQTTGTLGQIGSQVATSGDLSGPLAINADGTRLYVTNSASNSVSTFTVDPVTGVIALQGAPVATGTTPEGIAITP